MFKNVTFSGSNIANNTEPSSECIDLFGSTDHSRLSAIGGELTDDELSVSSRSSKQTPRFRINSSPDLNRKKPDMVPKLPHLADAEVQTGWLLMMVWSCFILCLPQ